MDSWSTHCCLLCFASLFLSKRHLSTSLDRIIAANRYGFNGAWLSDLGAHSTYLEQECSVNVLLNVYSVEIFFQLPDLRLRSANESKKLAMSSSSQTAFRSRSKTLPLPSRVKIEKKIVQEPKTRSPLSFRRLVRLSILLWCELKICPMQWCRIS